MTEIATPEAPVTTDHKFSKQVKGPGRPKPDAICAECGLVPAAHPKKLPRKEKAPKAPKKAASAPVAVVEAPSTSQEWNYVTSLQRLRKTVATATEENMPGADEEMTYLLDAACAWPRFPVGELQGRNNMLNESLIAFRQAQVRATKAGSTLPDETDTDEPFMTDSLEPQRGPFTSKVDAHYHAEAWRKRGFLVNTLKRTDAEKNVTFQLEITPDPSDVVEEDED